MACAFCCQIVLHKRAGRSATEPKTVAGFLFLKHQDLFENDLVIMDPFSERVQLNPSSPFGGRDRQLVGVAGITWLQLAGLHHV